MEVRTADRDKCKFDRIEERIWVHNVQPEQIVGVMLRNKKAEGRNKRNNQPILQTGSTRVRIWHVCYSCARVRKNLSSFSLTSFLSNNWLTNLSRKTCRVAKHACVNKQKVLLGTFSCNNSKFFLGNSPRFKTGKTKTCQESLSVVFDG